MQTFPTTAPAPITGQPRPRRGASLAFTLAVSILACGAVALFGGIGLRDVDAMATEIYEENLQPVQQLATAQGQFDDAILAVTLMNVATTPQATARHKQELQQSSA